MTNFKIFLRSRNKRGVALVLTLSILVLITVLVVGLSSILTTERSTARKGLDSQGAKIMAETARDHAIALLRDGIEGGRAQGKMWSSQPGRITVFNSDGTVDTTSSRDLSSGIGSADRVDLNQAPFSGNNPIASAASVGSGTAPTMQVNWVEVPNNPAINVSASNPVVGRYAFWVDDESSKINVNTADGTSKYTDPDYTAGVSSDPVSYGNGMPTEISLSALTNTFSIPITPAMTTNMAESIANVTGVRPGGAITRFFSSPSEILQPSAVPSNAYQDNNFNLTHYSRAPELNIFGEPKIYLFSAANTEASATPSNTSIGPYTTLVPGGSHGYATGLPIKQVYPSSNPLVYTNPFSPQAYIGNDVLQTGVGNQLPPFIHASPFNYFYNAFVINPNNVALPQYFAYFKHDQGNLTGTHVGNFAGTNWDSPTGLFYNYFLGMRIAQYLKGYNSQGNAITWPPFPGTKPDPNGITGFAGKYTDRQIDSITLQLMDTLSRNNNLDVNLLYGDLSSPMILPHGFLSPLPAKGVGRMPCLNQVLITFFVYPGNPPKIKIHLALQWWYPKGYKGVPPYDGAPNLVYSNNGDGYLNIQDCPPYDLHPYLADNVTPNPSFGHPTGPAPLGGSEPYWSCQMLNIKGQDGVDSGVDLFGNSSDTLDPDQTAAAKFHGNLGDSTHPYIGSGPVTGGAAYFYPALDMLSPYTGSSWTGGDFRSVLNGYSTEKTYQMRWVDPDNPSPPLPKLTKITIGGGITVWGLLNNLNPFPLDSCRGPNTGEDLNDANVRAAVMAAVLPMPTNPPLVLPVSDDPAADPAVGQVLLKVADPLVDNMPGDWTSEAITVTPNPIANTGDENQITMTDPYPYGAIEYPNGANPEFQADGGGDPDSYWLPEINQNIPKSQRFPSVGYMQYIRTGLMPDKADDLTGDPSDPQYILPTDTTYKLRYQAQHGTPFRLLSLAPSYAYDPAHPGVTTDPNPGQQTAGGASYPDWAMLDLFTSPVTPQPLPGAAATTPPYLEMTYGGSTPGRVNVNSPTGLVPFDASVKRLSPLEAVFKNVKVGTYKAPTMTHGLEEDVPTDVDEKALASAISSYLASLKDSNGVSRPFIMPGEVANVSAVANNVYGIYGHAQNTFSNAALPTSALSRNDLLRQSLGNLTTQSNTYSVWAVGQSLKNGLVMGEARTHYIVERYIDLGTDGVPGNAKSGSAGDDGIVGTPDDLIEGDDTPGHIVAGANPKMTYPLPYKYRVIVSEEIAN